MAELDRQHYLIAGLGKTGWSCVRFLRGRGARVAVTDTRPSPPMARDLSERYPEVRSAFGGLETGWLQHADTVIASPGLALTDPFFAAARARGLPIVGDIDLFARVADKPVAAVTGSNGKSTVTRLLADMAHAAGYSAPAGGNLGTPALDLLDSAADWYVLELSSFQLEATHALAPAVGAVLNVSADHMDRHASLALYAAAKARVYHGAAVAVVNTDDPWVRAMGRDSPRRITFSAGGPDSDTAYGLEDGGGKTWLVRGARRLIPAQALRLSGRHNLVNALAALAMGEALGLEDSAMLSALEVFPGLPHRCRRVAEHGGVVYYNDSKATNVDAALASLRGLPGPIVWIAGGQAKNADFAPLAGILREKARAIVLFGQDARAISRALSDGPALHYVEGLAAAVATAAALARDGDSVLFSPACASFDMFSGFEERGERFETQVRGLDPCAA